MAKKIETGAKQATIDIRTLGDEIVKLTKDLEGLEKGTADYEKVNSKLQTKMKQIGVQVKQNTTDHKNSKNAIDASIRSLRTLQGTLDRNSIEYAQASKSIREHQQSLNQNSAATGLASTSAMELGRVFSDAPYGIRGMANNVSQLTSLLFQGAGQISETTGKVIGLKGAIKGMWGAMMGPLGIMIAIQAVIAAIDAFAGSTSKAEEETKKLGNAFTKMQGDVKVSADELQVLYEVMSDGSAAVGEQAEALKDLKSLGFDPTTQSIDDFIEKQKELIILEASSDLIKKQLKKLVEDKAAMDTLSQGATDAYVEATKLVKQREELFNASGGDATFLAALDSAKALEADAFAVVTSLAEDRSKMTGFIAEDSKKFKDLLKQIMGLKDIINTGGSGDKGVKDFKVNQSKMNSTLTKSLRDQELLLAESNAEKLRLNNQYEEEDLLTTFNSEVEKDAAKLEVFLKGKASPEQKAEATRIHEENEKIRTSEYEESLTQIRYNAFIKENQLIEETRQVFSEQSIEKEIEREQNRLATLEEYLGNDPKSLAVLEEQQRLIWEKEDENFEIDLERRRTELFALYEDESQVQQIIDEERADRDRIRAEGEIQLERDKADAKLAIQLEYLNYVKGFGSVLSILGKKNKALAIAGLAVEKGSAIASIIVKATAANAKAVSDAGEFATATAAANAPLGALGAIKTAAMIGANVTATAATTAKTNITAGISIAKIAATSLTSSALGGSGGGSSSGGSSGGGGSTTFTPNFNVVGNSGANQLAEGISNQVNEPTRAYVVYEDIAEAGSVVEESIESSGI